MTTKTMHNENHSLLGNEWEKLEELGLRDSRCAALLSVDTLTLLDDETCLEVLRQIQPEIGAPDLKVTASLVIKRIAFLTLAPMLYAMSCYNKGLDVSIENCIFEYPLEDRLWRSKMPLKNVQVTVPLQTRDHWRQTLLTQAFQGNLSLLVTQLNKLTRVPSAVLWENIAVRIFSIYERWILSDLSQPQQLMIAQSDLAYLLDKNTTEIYNTPANPIARYHTEPSMSENPSKAVRVRRTCCYYYKATEPMKFCRNCPLLCKRKP
ncbi:IucA/IucC family C-terminal-domain containing protein [Vibrio gazogenes]|uniref:Ferric iron reductase protein FhuF, involved in iron transport n=1 Tax=Vibrio gazogenes DSM 21264 = NBRC 103151 TaxID=1123492 RepID=A0A1M4UQ17_VIBGA|nr:IucA/IucC family C-terminal-domain containing protein [Vibrio gazogenes]USP15711.1 (2Fe-2S)-binding protein [Vibrio gazogenes]SHE58826.1 Ferric iron reductase protein FhuF, involved in iron transport [Vibrio gazogenes DSM 21264] [Vibrio gazogenes DSM 21264 = NBRC 103151]SJN57710.1 Ferric iron reductase FhuF-like transporter [Vibrio gazogenes]